MSVTERVSEVQERMISDVETAQTRVIELNQRIADGLTDLLPEQFRLPTFEEFNAAEMVDKYFDFAHRMTEANRAFYKEMAAIWMPVEKIDGPAQAKKATKATAKASK